MTSTSVLLLRTATTPRPRFSVNRPVPGELLGFAGSAVVGFPGDGLPVRGGVPAGAAVAGAEGSGAATFSCFLHPVGATAAVSSTAAPAPVLVLDIVSLPIPG
ncbi:hypothetical protein GCM10010435_25430 [Winogradskya consettensis]|uniref:Uncharacterized protein n=1 Tax=Winogradskya consettensis TaxID=113560 RepID=A0A919SAH7_9ACTN|nr:hypothetical protein [Actinoplanes consettensis]GIM67879.1 hypothetical protein Aco04nite_08220 [Actinoplanes consettensis]